MQTGLRVGALAVVLVLIAATCARAGAIAATARRELVYVANADSGPVTAYVANAHGPVAPAREVADPMFASTVWNPWGVAFGPDGSLFVQTFLSDATSFVFDRSTRRPSRVFRVRGPDSQAIAVDQHGYEYVMGGEGVPSISVVTPEAAGLASNLYSVSAVRTIALDSTVFAPFPSTLAIDPNRELIVAVSRPAGNAIEVFQGGPTGAATAIRTIAGPQTMLGTCTGFDTCTHLAVAVDARARTIDIAVSSASGARILVFGLETTGDATPRRVIAGPATGLDSRLVTGIAVSRSTGRLFVLAKTAQFSAPGNLEAFAPTATGNATPIASFTDANTRLADAAGIAIGQ